MKIIGLQAENFKRLTAVNLNINGGHLILGGPNEAGKSSVLDAIWVALGGSNVMKDLKISAPIRKGAEKASIKLDLGDLAITRNWTSDDKMYLSVTTKDGAKYPSPQGMLDALMGKLFDPFEFSRMKEVEQREILLKLVDLGDLDLTKWATDRKGYFDQRTEVNREVTRLAKTLESSPVIEAPAEEVSSAAIFEELQTAQAIKEANDKKRTELEELRFSANSVKAHVDNSHEAIMRLQKEIERLQGEISDEQVRKINHQQRLNAVVEQGQKLKAEVDELQDPDLSVFQQRLAEVEQTNAKVRQARERAKLQHDLGNEQTKSNLLTDQLAEMDKSKSDAIKAAKFPIDGLDFDDSGVTFNGIPFGQCSSEERIRVGMVIAMAMSPKLKVIRIADGSLLDAKNFTLIQSMAAEQGYQLLVEVVGDRNAAVIIEDGCVKEAVSEEAAA